MTGAALREALYLWMRRPREMALANLSAFAALSLAWLLLRALRPVPPAAGLVSMGLLAWALASALCAACLRLDRGDEHPWAGLADWLESAWAERLGAFAVGLLGALWFGLAAGFYRAVPLPPPLRFGLLALLAVFGSWLAAALLLSVGGAAAGDRPWWGLWKACALLPPAYPRPVLAVSAVFFAALALPAMGLSLDAWGARLWLAPLLLCPVFTLAFLAAYLTALVRALLGSALGLPARQTPSWRELWTLWR